MFKLPVCPYCKTVYDYKEVKENKNKIIKCYHCKRNFKKINKSFILLFLIVVISIIINTAIFSVSDTIKQGLIFAGIVSVIAVLLYLLLSPYFISYKSFENTEKDK